MSAIDSELHLQMSGFLSRRCHINAIIIAKGIWYLIIARESEPVNLFSLIMLGLALSGDLTLWRPFQSCCIASTWMISEARAECHSSALHFNNAHHPRV